MAQDFKAVFNLGTDDKSISTIDPSGIALLAIQQLIKENETLRRRIEALEKKKLGETPAKTSDIQRNKQPGSG